MIKQAVAQERELAIWRAGVWSKTRLACLIGLVVLPVLVAVSGVTLLHVLQRQASVAGRLDADQTTRTTLYALARLNAQAQADAVRYAQTKDPAALARYRERARDAALLRDDIHAAFRGDDRRTEAALARLDQDSKALDAQAPAACVAAASDDCVSAGLDQLVALNGARVVADRTALTRVANALPPLIAVRLVGTAILAGCVVMLIRLAALDWKRQAAVLLRARREADAANRAKSQFLANMSHEIRTPLNGVLAMAQLMGREQLTASQKDKLAVIRASSEDLLHVLNQVLDFSKIEAGKIELEQVSFDPEAVIGAAVAGFHAVARAKGLGLDLRFDGEAKGPRLGDPSRVRQIVVNFVSNALKFSFTGAVGVEVTASDADGREGLRIAVRDTGVGVPPEKMALLFKKFSQADSSTTRRFGGTGLGLAICSELAGLMGGRVWAESELGSGSAFFVELPLPRVGMAVALDTDAPHLGDADWTPRRLRVLAAEDNATNRQVLAAVMEAFGWELTQVEDGRQAVQAWKSGGFDLVLMDVQMPVMDGVAATQMIRREEAQRRLPRTPIVALSANAFSHQIAEYAAAGMDGHVAKPIDLGALQAVLEQVLQREALEARATA